MAVLKLFLGLVKAVASGFVFIIAMEVIASRIGVFSSKSKNRLFVYTIFLSLLATGALLYYYI